MEHYDPVYYDYRWLLSTRVNIYDLALLYISLHFGSFLAAITNDIDLDITLLFGIIF